MNIKKFSYEQAKDTITAICTAAAEGAFDEREKFIGMLDANPHLAVQGYNTHGKIFYWNEASAHLYGHSESAAVKRDLFELILPLEMRSLARDMILSAARTGRMPEPSACDLMRYNGERVTVFSGHLIFKWGGTYPEFYCVDLPFENGF